MGYPRMCNWVLDLAKLGHMVADDTENRSDRGVIYSGCSLDRNATAAIA